MLYASIDATALSAAKVPFLFAGLFGAQTQILSDKGPQYVNELIKEFLYIMGSDHQLTSAYSHQENALVERANKEVLQRLRTIIFHQKIITRWSLALPHSFSVL